MLHNLLLWQMLDVFHLEFFLSVEVPNVRIVRRPSEPRPQSRHSFIVHVLLLLLLVRTCHVAIELLDGGIRVVGLYFACLVLVDAVVCAGQLSVADDTLELLVKGGILKYWNGRSFLSALTHFAVLKNALSLSRFHDLACPFLDLRD